MGVPKEVCMSKVDTLVSVEGKSLVDGAGKKLSESQLSEVVAVYNAWRVGNLQDCTIRGPEDFSRMAEASSEWAGRMNPGRRW